MKESNFDKLFKTIMESVEEDSFLKDNDENISSSSDAPETTGNNDETIEPDTDSEKVIGEDDDDEDGDNIDFSEMSEIPEDEAREIYADWKADDDPINKSLITMENIFANHIDENNPSVWREWKDNFFNYCSEEWGIERDELNDEQDYFFYVLAYLVNNFKAEFDSEEEWKKYYVLYEAESQDSQCIIYPTWMQGRGMLDFFWEYFDEADDEDDQDYDDQDEETSEEETPEDNVEGESVEKDQKPIAKAEGQSRLGRLAKLRTR